VAQRTAFTALGNSIKKNVAREVGYPAALLRRVRLHEVQAQRLPTAQGTALINRHEAREARHIREHDGSKVPIDLRCRIHVPRLAPEPCSEVCLRFVGLPC
jgi:hypothetical protein